MFKNIIIIIIIQYFKIIIFKYPFEFQVKGERSISLRVLKLFTLTSNSKSPDLEPCFKFIIILLASFSLHH